MPLFPHNLNRDTNTPDLWYTVGANILILIGAIFSAIQMRYLIPLGKTLGPDEQIHYLEWFVTVVGAVFFVYGVVWFASKSRRIARFMTVRRQFWLLNFSALTTAAVIFFALSDVSGFQLIYFLGIAGLLGILDIVIPGRIRAKAYHHTNTILDDLKLLVKNRVSMGVWLNFRIKARYSQTVLGILWVFFEPLLTALVIYFVLDLVWARPSTNVPIVSLLLSGLVVFNFFSGIVSKSTTLILRNGNLIQQVYFPREILSILEVGEALIDMFFAFLALLLINAYYGIPISQYYIYLFVPLFFLICYTLGLSLLVSWLGLLIRDIGQVIGVVLRLLFYITVFYYGENLGEFTFILYLNPLVGILQVFRDIVLYAQMPDFSELYLTATFSIAILYLGYVTFKTNEDLFADYV